MVPLQAVTGTLLQVIVQGQSMEGGSTLLLSHLQAAPHLDRVEPLAKVKGGGNTLATKNKMLFHLVTV